MIEWDPTVNVDVVYVALPLLSVPVPNVVLPSLNVTVPVAAEGVTVATDEPKVDGLADEDRAVVVFVFANAGLMKNEQTRTSAAMRMFDTKTPPIICDGGSSTTGRRPQTLLPYPTAPTRNGGIYLLSSFVNC